jgi:hypothetical protein
MSSPNHFFVRDATLAQDEAFVISVFDASLPYLSSLGSQAQWGSIPFSQRPGWIDETQRQMREAEQNAVSNTTDALRILVLEAEFSKQDVAAFDCKDVYLSTVDDGRCRVAVGFAFVRGNWLPKYLPKAAVDQSGQVRREESLYVEVMVSDNRIKDGIRGVGAALLRELRRWGCSRGKKVLYLDGWAGNERKLIRLVAPSSATRSSSETN